MPCPYNVSEYNLFMSEPTAKTCPRCDQPLSGTEKVCPSCRKPLGKTEGLASVGAKGPICPICKISLYPATLDTHDVLHCAECEGLAVSREVMMKLQPQGKTELDQCEKCGSIWLEGPTLEMLQEIIGPYKWKAIKRK